MPQLPGGTIEVTMKQFVQTRLTEAKINKNRLADKDNVCTHAEQMDLCRVKRDLQYYVGHLRMDKSFEFALSQSIIGKSKIAVLVAINKIVRAIQHGLPRC